jgi:hypothetical protein
VAQPLQGLGRQVALPRHALRAPLVDPDGAWARPKKLPEAGPSLALGEPDLTATPEQAAGVDRDWQVGGVPIRLVHADANQEHVAERDPAANPRGPEPNVVMVQLQAPPQRAPVDANGQERGNHRGDEPHERAEKGPSRKQTLIEALVHVVAHKDEEQDREVGEPKPDPENHTLNHALGYWRQEEIHSRRVPGSRLKARLPVGFRRLWHPG